MKKLLLTLILAVAATVPCQPAGPDTSWFEEARFGMFIHFGPYSVLGSGEWVMNTRPITAQSYLRLQDFFNPHRFDAAEWVSIARNAGMKYITFTSRHHDSFSNWDTRESDWNIMNTPYGKDIIRQLADECARQDVKLCFYYSTLDWIRDDYQWRTGRTGQGSGRTVEGDWEEYISFMKNQLTELLTRYGPIGSIWFDGHWDQTSDQNRTDHSTHVDWHYDEIYALIRELQPDCLIANNHHLPPLNGEDYQIFERDVPGENLAGHSGQEISRLPLETCQTINDSWGFRITDENYKSVRELIHLLVRTAGTGANLLLNVGPMPDGRIQRECVDRLAEIGNWMERHGETIYATSAGPVKPQPWGAVTAKGDRLFVHVLEPDAGPVELPAMDIRSAVRMETGEPVPWTVDASRGTVTLEISGSYDPVDTIIVVERIN
ncbi:MAG: alpha-L-fucosidase [Alistipes sp.]|nr:alpha-L-fucosidase [Alistipes sp.]